jgi:predicted hotdog family 3-hydroxylacyl-ACP dehydratase
LHIIINNHHNNTSSFKPKNNLAMESLINIHTAELMTPLLNHADIAKLIPHSANMCLLEQLLAYTADEIEVLACEHTHADHPLREAGRLFSTCLIEYAAQAMALHGALLAGAGFSPAPGFIASVRNVQFHTLELDAAAAPMRICAQRLAGSEREVLYAFEVCDAHQTPLAQGRATVVLKLAP